MAGEHYGHRLKPISTQLSSSSSSGESEQEPEELQLIERAPPFWRNPRGKKKLSKQLSMCETPQDVAWERRRRQILLQERKKNGIGININDADVLTDEDLNELKGSIELGFGFNEEQGMRLCHTLPALDLYFAVNRQFSPSSPVLSPNTPHSHSSPASTAMLGGSSLSTGGGGSSSSSSLLTSSVGSSSSKSLGQRSSSFGSPRSDSTDSWKILSPGDDPEQVKTKLRHWAQAVACSVMQSY